MDFNKTENIKTHDQLKDLMSNQKEFLESGEGVPRRFLSEFRHLLYREGDKILVKSYKWVGKTLKEIEAAKAETKAKTDLIKKYKSDIEFWRSQAIKPWSLQKLSEWVDSTYTKPLEYDLTPDQMQERIDKRLELLEYHNQVTYIENPVKPEPPSYIK